MQLCQASPPHKPCMILGVLYFWFCRVSLAEYLLVLRIFPHLLQMTSSTLVAASIAFSLLGIKTRLLGAVSPSSRT
jgi:hypothetical protein